jgi:hypothetical protein
MVSSKTLTMCIGQDKALTSEDATYFSGHSATIHLRLDGKERVIGSLGM